MWGAAAGSGALGLAAEQLLSRKLFALGVHLDVSLAFIQRREKKAAHRAALSPEPQVTTRGEEQTDERSSSMDLLTTEDTDTPG